MALEDLTGTGKFITALNPAWPVDDDWVDEGDNHIRGIKNVLKNTFPGWNGAQGFFPDGAVTGPGISWANATQSGWYRDASGDGYAVNGVMALRITGGRAFKATTYSGGTFGTGVDRHEFHSVADNIPALTVVNGSNPTPAGLDIFYNNYNARVAGHLYWGCRDVTGALGYFTGNGGLTNFSANNANLSDALAKQETRPGPDYTEFVAQLRFKRFRYRDDLQPGREELDDVTAQDIEELAPELIGPDFGDTGFKTVYTHRLQQRINSVVPRLIERIKALEAQLGARDAGN